MTNAEIAGLQPLIRLYKINKYFFYHTHVFNNSKDLTISSLFNLIVLGDIITAILILFLIKLLKYKARNLLLKAFLATALPRRLLITKPSPTESRAFGFKCLYVRPGVLRIKEDLKTE